MSTPTFRSHPFRWKVINENTWGIWAYGEGTRKWHFDMIPSHEYEWDTYQITVAQVEGVWIMGAIAPNVYKNVATEGLYHVLHTVGTNATFTIQCDEYPVFFTKNYPEVSVGIHVSEFTN